MNAKRMRLSDVANIYTGVNPKSPKTAFGEGGCSWVMVEDLKQTAVAQTARRLTPEGMKRARISPAGTIFFSRTGTIGKVGIAKEPMAPSNNIIAVEFRREPGGVPLRGREGQWLPYPVEYKRGRPKEHNADELQLCAQAMCLEEMLCCDVPEGALYYGEPHRRTVVLFTSELRGQVRDSLAEMHQLYQRHHTPKVRPSKSCNACSLKDLCLPGLVRSPSVSEYLRAKLEDLP